jgi:hypothetical protein
VRADAGRGRLVAVEAARGQDAERGAEAVRAALARPRHGVRAGISHWDASGTFYELRLAGRKAVVLSPRTLLLLYASDLAFRLRWEIEPAIASGQVVIAVQYVETAIAFGETAGLPRAWIAELLRFAPRPDVCLHVADPKHGAGWKRAALGGFPEFGAMALHSGHARRKGLPRCERSVEALRRLKRRPPRCDDLRKKTLRSLVKTLQDHRREAPRKD